MRSLEVVGFGLRRAALSVADGVITHPWLSWTWTGAPETRFVPRLSEFKPADPQTVIEMMEGKYLFAGRFVDTAGLSPFALDTEIDDWFEELHGFGWLRHFAALADPGQRAFARTLVMDWIGRFERFDPDIWSLELTALRILSWLKAYGLLTDGATPEQIRTIARVLSAQIHALKVRMRLSSVPQTRLMIAIALLGAELSRAEESRDMADAIARLDALLEENIDADGLTKTRNPCIQIEILTEIIPVNRALAQRHGASAMTLARRIEAMHRALDALVLTTREPAYVNGCGQVPVELVLAIMAQSGARTTGSGLCGGYGILAEGSGKLVADGGQIPPLGFSTNAHAGALAFEYTCGPILLSGNCGPAPGQLAESRDLFRHSSAHSAPTIDDLSSARIGGPFSGGALHRRGPDPHIAFDPDENAVEMQTGAYRDRFGLDITRRLTLLAGGQTLVGQDRLTSASSRSRQEGQFSIRFHLALGVAVDRSAAENLVRLVYRNGEVWAFLWEGAEADVEESVRHSAHFGFNRTRQIVLSGPAVPGAEIAWVFTRQS